MSRTFKKVVEEPDGGLFGPSERLRMSTPSATACHQEIDLSLASVDITN